MVDGIDPRSTGQNDQSVQAIQSVARQIGELTEAITSGYAPVSADFVTYMADATLPNSRALTDTTEVSWNVATAGQVKAVLGIWSTTNTWTGANQFTTTGMQIGSPTGGNAGAGTINVATGYYVNNALLPVGKAVQADQETGTSTTLAVTPGVQQFHPSAAKCWAYVTVSAGTPTLQTNYNITSITDTATGRLTVTIATDFSSANWASDVSVQAASNATAVANRVFPCVANGGKAAGSVELNCWDGTAVNSNLVDPAAWSLIGYGDQ